MALKFSNFKKAGESHDVRDNIGLSQPVTQSMCRAGGVANVIRVFSVVFASSVGMESY